MMQGSVPEDETVPGASDVACGSHDDSKSPVYARSHPSSAVRGIAAGRPGSSADSMRTEPVRREVQRNVRVASTALARSVRSLSIVSALLAVLALGWAQPATALASVAAPDFPRLGMWWPDLSTQPVADIARYDFVGMRGEDAGRIAELRAANPSIKLFGNNNAQELNYREDDYNHPLNVALRSASLSWALTQVGSRLTSGVDANTNVFPVAEISKSGLTLFAVGDVLVVDNELLKITAINGLNLTVKRGTSMGTPAASHAAGARIAAVVAAWPDSVTMNVTGGCPLADVGSGSERWTDWNARRLHTALHAADWDGIVIDSMDSVESYRVRQGSLRNRSIDPDRSNAVVTDYTAFDVAWNAGNIGYAAKARALVGPDAILLPNIGVRAFDDLNGAIFEGFPFLAIAPMDWHKQVIGPAAYQRGSYLEWSAARAPSYSLIETYEYDGWLSPNPFGSAGWRPDFQKMRFGLTTALMGDGYFSYEMAYNGHGLLGLMWFDEYDNAGVGRGYLGQAAGPARLAFPPPATPDLLGGDGAFDTAGQLARWSLWSADTGYAGTTSLDGGAARVDVTAAGGLQYRLSLVHSVPLTGGTAYTLTFRARADRPVNARVGLYNWSSTYDALTAFQELPLDTSWRAFEIPWTSVGTDPAAVVRFMLGEKVGTVWIDDVKVQTGSRPDVWRRDFAGGIALVNPTDAAVWVDLGGTFRKLKGTQAPTVNDGSLVTAVTLRPNDGLVLLATSEILDPGSQPPAPKPQTLVHRFYNVRTGTHFYTASAAEKDNVIATLSSTYRYEGAAYTVNNDNPDNNVPLHRFYNVRTGTHFYTASTAEKDKVVATLSSSYRYEGVAYYVSSRVGGQPVHRFYNVRTGTHFYTASADEKAAVIAKLSSTYRYEGPAFYLAP
jgi:hypothetical protein